ncbi:MAG: FAD-dependent oxidoreductase [Thermoanaerobaculia bacterium]
MKARVLVIGSGVSGLTSALRLREEGFDAHIVAKDLALETTSSVAAALWYPYRAYPLDRVVAWGMESLERFREFARDRASGITDVPLQELLTDEGSDPGWRRDLPDFRILRRDELPPGYRSGFSATVPVIETPVYLPWLEARFRSAGGRITPRTIDNLVDAAAGVDLVVNCSGLGARTLCGDTSLHPIRGQLVRTEKGDVARATVDEEGPGDATYIVPRSHDCILGSTSGVNDWRTETDPHETEEILARCRRLDPRVAELEVLDVRVGLRPGRPAVRLEIERMPHGAVIHNYGHGGSGVTLSWGCANEVVRLAEACITHQSGRQ